MKVVAEYSFNKGKEVLSKNYLNELNEVYSIIESVNSEKCKTKVSKEKTMKGQLLYSPKLLNSSFKKIFQHHKWKTERVLCEYSCDYYTSDYISKPLNKGAFREMDFIKNRVGVEVQLGKYAFMVYNVCAKMTIFNNFNLIDCGIEIVPVKDLARNMSTGVSYFEQIVWDLEHRGVADIDIPVLIVGIL